MDVLLNSLILDIYKTYTFEIIDIHCNILVLDYFITVNSQDGASFPLNFIPGIINMKSKMSIPNP